MEEIQKNKEIYILDSSFEPTAAATNRLLSFALALKKKGVKITFFYLFPNNRRDKCNRYIDDFEYKYLWEGSLFSNKYYNTLRSLIKFNKLTKPNIPVYSYSNINSLFFILKKNIKIFHEQTENPEIVGKINGVFGSFLYFLYKNALKRIDGLFVITGALRDKYIHELGANPETTFILNMTVDQKRFSDLQNIEPSKTISYCGYISEFKDGVSVLIKAFALVCKRFPGYTLQIIGPFADKITEIRLFELVKSLQIENKVIFTGPVSADSMPLLLKSSKILALARPDNIQAKYGFATKIGEYLMTERPVVLTKVGAVEEFLNDKINCILSEPDNVDDFADKLCWTIEHYEEAANIGQNGKQIALKYFNSEIEAEKLYNNIF